MSNTGKPLGIAVVTQAGKGFAAINHVKITKETVSMKKLDDVEWKYATNLSGAWKVSLAESALISDLCRNHVVVYDRPIPEFANLYFQVGELGNYLNSIKGCADQLMETWEDHVAAEPKKRKTLVRPALPLLPIFNVKAVGAAAVLESLGKAGSTSGTPNEMAELVAMSRLVMYLASSWVEIESQRTTRKYLGLGPRNPRQFPPGFTNVEGVQADEQLELL